MPDPIRTTHIWRLWYPGDLDRGDATFLASDLTEMSIRLVGTYLSLGAPTCHLRLSVWREQEQRWVPVQDWTRPDTGRLAEDSRNLSPAWFDLAAAELPGLRDQVTS